MFRRAARFGIRWLARGAAAGLCFAGGWGAYLHFHPRPLLQDRWSALVRAGGAGGAETARGRESQGPAGEKPGTRGEGAAFSLEDLLGMRDPIGQSAALVEALKTADAATCQEWFTRLEAHPHPGVRFAAVGAILERWTAIDPRGALEAMGGDRERRSGVLRQWAHHDPAAALAASGGEDDDAIRQGIMETDPDHAYTKWKAIAPDKPFPVTTLEFALRSLARTDPAAALRQIPTDDDYQTNEIRRRTFGAWMDRDPDAAFHFAENHADARVKGELLAEIGGRFPERVEPLLAGMDARDRRVAALGIADGKVGRDPVAGARWLGSVLPAGEYEGALNEYVRKRQGLSGEQLGLLLQLCPSKEAAEKTLLEMSGGRPEEAVRSWLKSQDAGTLSPALRKLAFQELSSAEAAALLPSPGIAPDEAIPLMKQVSRSWRADHPAEVAANLAQLPAEMRTAAAGAFLGQPRYIIEKDGMRTVEDKLAAAATAEIFAALPPEAQGRLAVNFAWQQQRDDPAMAARTLAYSEQAADDPATAAAHESVARAWLHTDPLAASAWIEGLAPGPARDAAALALVENQAASDPAAALAWARTLRDPVSVEAARRLLPSTPAAR